LPEIRTGSSFRQLPTLEQTVRYGLRFPIVLTLALAGVYGCGDDVTDPDAFLESAEAEAVMLSAEQLPMLPDLLASATPASRRDEAVLLRAQELWAQGSVADDRAGARRRLAVRYALPVLGESVSGEEWTAAREGLEDWIVTVERLLDRLALPEVEERILAARRYLEWSDGSAAEPRRQRYYLLLGMSELVETTPRWVARRLVGEAHRAVARAETAHETASEPGEGPERPLSERTLERAQRLKDWADRAVVEGEYLLAIQRAYYAIQLVEGP
jgi:hypothetical protein